MADTSPQQATRRELLRAFFAGTLPIPLIELVVGFVGPMMSFMRSFSCEQAQLGQLTVHNGVVFLVHKQARSLSLLRVQDGKQLGVFKLGTESARPTCVAAGPNDTLYVCDRFNAQILAVTPSGKQIRQW